MESNIDRSRPLMDEGVIVSVDGPAGDRVVRGPDRGLALLLQRPGHVEAGVAGEGHDGPVGQVGVGVGQLAVGDTGVLPASSFTSKRN